MNYGVTSISTIIGAIDYNVITLYVQCTLYLLGKFFHPYFCQLLHQSRHQNLKHLQKKEKKLTAQKKNMKWCKVSVAILII